MFWQLSKSELIAQFDAHTGDILCRVAPAIHRIGAENPGMVERKLIADTDAVLRECGLGDAEIASLRADGAL